MKAVRPSRPRRGRFLLAGLLAAAGLALCPAGAGGETAGAPAPSSQIPRGVELSRIVVERCTPGSPPLDEAALRGAMDRARPLRPVASSSDPWHYSPWCAGSFVARGETYRFLLFLGGRGDLVLPGGARIRFDLEPEP